MSQTHGRKNKLQDGYQEVQIGPESLEIPEEWTVTTVGDVASRFISGGTPDSGNEDYWDGDIPWTTSAVVEGPLFAGEKDFITQEGLENSSASLVPKGGILFGTRVNVANVGRTTKEIAISQDLTGIVLDENKVYPDFVVWYLLLNQAKIQDRYSQGSTIQGMLTDDLKSLPLLSPSLPEQRRIADILSTVDEQIRQTDDVIKKTKELKHGLMQKLLIRGQNTESTQEVQIGPKISQIPNHWNMKSCGQLFEAINGRAFKTEEWEEEGTQIIRIQDLRPDAEAETNYAGFEVKEKYHVTEGDLLFCWAGNIKTSLGAYIWDGKDSYLNQHIYNLRPKEEMDRRFFAYSLNQHLRLLKTMVGGSAGQVHITKADFESFRLPVPPVEEQKKISEIIGTAQKRMEEEQERKEKLQEFKRGLMQDLLTGKVRVDPEQAN